MRVSSLFLRFAVGAVAAFGVAFIVASSSVALGREPSLLDIVQSTPKPANAVVMMNIEALRKLSEGSPIQADLSENVRVVKLAAEINFATITPEWEIGYAGVRVPPNADELAGRFGGYVESFQNRQCVWTPRQMYLVPIDNEVLAVVRPTDRKLLGQWLRKERTNGTSAILKDYASKSYDDEALMIAIDLEDALSVSSLKKTLPGFQATSTKNVESLATLIGGIRGIQLTVSKSTFKNSVVRLTFSNSPAPLLGLAKPLLNEVLNRRGASITGLEQWSIKVDGPDLVLQGELTDANVDDLLGIFTVQDQAANAASQATSASTSASVVAEASREYFKKLNGMISRVRDYSAKNTGERAQWNGNMARRMDELPTLNVDPELVSFSAEIAKSLRTNMVSMQLTNIAAGNAANVSDAGTTGYSTFSGVSAYGGSYGYYNDPNSPMKYYQMGQAQGNVSFKQLIGTIEQSNADMRRRMTEKHKIQF